MAAQASDLLSGGHAVVGDGGALYQDLRGLPSAATRVSSHPSLGTQYEIPGGSTGPILFGLTPDGASTWFQLEGHDASGLSLAAFAHVADYVKYLESGQNQSLFGSSSYTDGNPLVLGAAHNAPVLNLPLGDPGDLTGAVR